jgi:valyl-tRNA synthetase
MPHPNPSPEGEGLDETRRVAAWAFDQILVMLHPFMPFVTEELWNANERPYELIVAEWPKPEAVVDVEAKAELEWVIELIQSVRSARVELGIPPSQLLDLHIEHLDANRVNPYFSNQQSLRRLARIDRTFATKQVLAMDLAVKGFDRLHQAILRTQPLSGTVMQVVAAGLMAKIDLEGVIDLDAERARLSKAAEAAEKERDSVAGRLANPNFTERAKPEAIEKARSDHAAKSAEAERLRAALERLG